MAEAHTEFSLPHARHLLNRAGFGGRPEELAAAQQAGRDATIAQLLSGPTRVGAAPAWLADEQANNPAAIFKEKDPEKRKEMQTAAREHGISFVTDWLAWMIAAPTPADMLHQRLGWFWHELFATSIQKVKIPTYMYLQWQWLQAGALGRYSDLLHALVRDPAMLVYLDNVQNRRGNPNENLAREIMELFSLGRGNYTEADIREGARALTGYGVSREKLGFEFHQFAHDRGSKTILGRSGDFDADGFVDAILAQDACASYVARRLWHYFAGGPDNPAVVAELAAVLRQSGYALKPTLTALFQHPAFYADAVVGQQLRSPIHLVVGTARTLRLQTSFPRFYLLMLGAMGQVPYLPPNVKGWPGDTAWITTSRLLSRDTFAELVADGKLPAGFDPRMAGDAELGMQGAAMKEMRDHFKLEADYTALLGDATTPEAATDRFTDFLLAQPPTPEERHALVDACREAGGPGTPDGLRRLVTGVLLLPQYQLA